MMFLFKKNDITLRVLMWTIAALAMFWLAAFGHFLQSIPRNPVGTAVSTDAIIVLTGGSLRITYGFELLEQGKAQKLFISGVGKDSTLESLLVAHNATPRLRERLQAGEVEIALGHVADSTRGNAEETARWIADEQIRSLRLVTSNYHLPRSMKEFRRLMPDVIMIPDPVFPDSFKYDEWWRDSLSRTLILSEFHKYVVSWLYWEVI